MPNFLAALPIYSVLSIGLTVGIVTNAVKTQRTFFDIVVQLTSSKLNLVIFFNCLVVILTNAANLLIYTFFGSVRSVESKFLIDKCQKKIFQFLLLTVVLRNSIDIYKAGSLYVILSIWLLHWLASKRSKGLIGEENRDKQVHIRLQILFASLIFFDGLVTYIFAVQFYKHGTKMSDIYIMAGFEFGRLLLKALEDNFKYQISLFELYYQEQWQEKKFVFNCISLVFDSGDLIVNLKLFFFIISRGALPIYILSEILDNLTRLFESACALYKWRQFIQKLKMLPDYIKEGEEDLQCIVCLNLIDSHKGKVLSCGHVFHLICLRSWLIEKVECPTCKKPIQLDKQPNQARRRHERRIVLERRQQNRFQGAAAAENQESSGDSDGGQDSDNTKPDKAKVQKGQTKGIFKPEKQTSKTEKELLKQRDDLIEMLNDRLEKQAQGKSTSSKLPKTKAGGPLLDKGVLDGHHIEEIKQSIENESLEEMKESELLQETKQPTQSQLLSGQSEDRLYSDQEFEDSIQPDSRAISMEERSQKVTDRLLELQQKHKEISDRVQNVLIETVDLALGGAPPELKEYLMNDSPAHSPQQKKKSSKRRARRDEGLELEKLQYMQGVGSVPYGLPCLAVTRRTTQQQLQLKEIERINTKLCQIMRVPADFIDVEKGGDIDPDEELTSD